MTVVQKLVFGEIPYQELAFLNDCVTSLTKVSAATFNFFLRSQLGYQCEIQNGGLHFTCESYFTF